MTPSLRPCSTGAPPQWSTVRSNSNLWLTTERRVETARDPVSYWWNGTRLTTATLDHRRGHDWLEFSRLPTDEPDLVDVHFGVAPGAGSWWETRWHRACKATEWDHATRTDA